MTAEVDPKAAVADMKARIAALATDDASQRVLLATIIDLTVPHYMTDARRPVGITLDVLETEVRFQLHLLRERRGDRRGGDLR